MIVELAIGAECSAVATMPGALGILSRRRAHKFPMVVKLNHDEPLTYPNKFDQVPSAEVRRAVDPGAAGVGATVYFGSPGSTGQIREVAGMSAEAHRHGLFTVLWCHLRSDACNEDGVGCSVPADLTGQANRMGVMLEADIIR